MMSTKIKLSIYRCLNLSIALLFPLKSSPYFQASQKTAAAPTFTQLLKLLTKLNIFLR